MNQHDPHTNLPEGSHHHHRPYWKRAHHDWKFWVAIVLMVLALGIYVSTIDLSFLPWARTK
jgi:hypothetical protein